MSVYQKFFRLKVRALSWFPDYYGSRKTVVKHSARRSVKLERKKIAKKFRVFFSRKCLSNFSTITFFFKISLCLLTLCWAQLGLLKCCCQLHNIIHAWRNAIWSKWHFIYQMFHLPSILSYNRFNSLSFHHLINDNFITWYQFMI